MTPKSRSRSPIFELNRDLPNMLLQDKFEVPAKNICQDRVFTRPRSGILTSLLHLMTPKSRSRSPIFELIQDTPEMYPQCKFRMDPSNIYEVMVFTNMGTMGQSDGQSAGRPALQYPPRRAFGGDGGQKCKI